ncbi:MAG: iron-sulfur cluster assembly protein [Fimbriimonadaceae bacterium]|jgi:iron-sulfur cluster assembly protein|nr:iron-sulfur cluster assembly protein [Fimbriimonadaceae bacterium]
MAQPQELDSAVFPIEVTAPAVEQIKRLVAKDGRPEVFLRVGVKGGGCSGFEYVLKLDTKHTPFDMELDVEGVKVVCDSKSAVYLRGSALEYTGNLIGGGFKVVNPNAARSCGCGTSFTPKAV